MTVEYLQLNNPEEQLKILEFIKDYKKILQTETKKKILQDQIWNLRRAEKLKYNKKINVVFVCSRPATWETLKTVCEAFITDGSFNVKIVTIPELEPKPNIGYQHKQFSDLGAFEYLSKLMDCRVIEGYNQKGWFDLKLLEPDYIFFQTPYNATRPELYHSSIVSSYAKICYIPYCLFVMGGITEKIIHPHDFFSDISLFFNETNWHLDINNKYYENIPKIMRPLMYVSGYPRFDNILNMVEVESDAWNLPRSEEITRIIWTPRWTRTGNSSNLLDYLDFFFKLCDENQDLDFLFRPHPLTFPECLAKGYMNQESISSLFKEYQSRKNMGIDTCPQFQSTFFSSDLLVTDPTSLMSEYLITGKPIIYCHRENNFSNFGERLSEAFYWAYSAEDVTNFIRNIRSGFDPLKIKRQNTAEEMFKLSKAKETAGVKIKNIIKKHFEG